MRRFPAIWEMACGDGALVLPLRRAGFSVIASDIRARGCPNSFVDNFLAGDAAKKRAVAKAHFAAGRFAYVTNPPFNWCDAFILRACELSDYVAMLLRFRYLAPQHFVVSERSKTPIWLKTRIPLARVIIPYSRFPMMHRDGYRGPKTSGMTDFAWFVWERGHRGHAQIVRAPRLERFA